MMPSEKRSRPLFPRSRSSSPGADRTCSRSSTPSATAGSTRRSPSSSPTAPTSRGSVARATRASRRSTCDPREYPDRDAYDARARRSAPQTRCRSGLPRRLHAPGRRRRCSRRFPNRILNIHPSLLPAFPGLDAQRQALDHGVRVTGATVHLVTAELDGGPIILQAAVPVLDDDTVETLSARILIEEHALYPEAIRIVLGGGWSLAGRRFVGGRPVRPPEGTRMSAVDRRGLGDLPRHRRHRRAAA